MSLFAKPEKLNLYEMERVIGFFLYRMDQDTRRKLMAEMPLQYKKMYPSCDDIVIHQAVVEGLNGLS